MSSFRKHWLHHLVLSITCTLALPSISKGNLTNYFIKYQDVSISTGDLLKLSEYDFLIEHFCGFLYFKPNHNVNPNFNKALILTESVCNQRAVSQKKALGLSQIVYPTGKNAAKEI